MDATLAQILETLFVTTQRVRELESRLASIQETAKETDKNAVSWGQVPSVSDAIGQARAPGDFDKNGQGARDEGLTAPY